MAEAGKKRKLEEAPVVAAESAEASITPLQREVLHGQQEQDGTLTFPSTPRPRRPHPPPSARAFARCTGVLPPPPADACVHYRRAAVENDGSDEALVMLTNLKNIFAAQLPKMPRDYISRLVYDPRHESLACVFEGEVVGGVTYRPHRTQAFSEIAFCAVSEQHQVQGYGTRIMNQLKEKCKRDGIEGLLTYADNHAIGYFRKQGFSKQVSAQIG